MSQSENKLLAVLSPEVFQALQPHLKVREYKQGAVLAESGSPVTEVYFPYSGIVSLVVELKEGDMVEAAMVGRDGVVNAASALDGKVALNKAIVQLQAQLGVIHALILAAVADQHRELRALLIRHEQVLFAESQQSGACNASHLVEARLSRWLLRMRDLVQSDELTVTQEFLGQMLGVQRSSISLVAGVLQKADLIRYRRGHIKILDVDRLKEAACECYETVKGHYDQAFGDRVAGERRARCCKTSATRFRHPACQWSTWYIRWEGRGTFRSRRLGRPHDDDPARSRSANHPEGEATEGAEASPKLAAL